MKKLKRKERNSLKSLLEFSRNRYDAGSNNESSKIYYEKSKEIL